MKHLGLFEGIGGFSLAARWMNWTTAAWCEINPFCQQVLKHHFPDAIGHGDITKTDFTPYANTIDILTGGFPCQPFSVAGERRGYKDDRYLWPEMLRAIKEIGPRWIVGENVAGIIKLALDKVLSDLEAEGYTTETFILPACAINAPHRRDRVWIIAHSNRQGLSFKWEPERIFKTQGQALPSIKRGNVMEPLLRSAIPGDAEPPICRAGHGIPARVDRIKALGNAIVPGVAYEIFKAIEQFELINSQ